MVERPGDMTNIYIHIYIYIYICMYVCIFTNDKKDYKQTAPQSNKVRRTALF